jgi:hypothetical protein
VLAGCLAEVVVLAVLDTIKRLVVLVAQEPEAK